MQPNNYVPYDFSPACWSWEPPAAVLRDQVRESNDFHLKFLSSRIQEEILDDLVLSAWQDRRCATCGSSRRELVEDHDHATGLVRGYLCRGCNTAEGMNGDNMRLWREYRERNPASICGLRIRYYNPYTRQFAEPDPDYYKRVIVIPKGFGI